MINVSNMTVRFGDLTIVDNLSFTLEENQWLMIVGPNGAGKSTVINAISQGVPYEGNVFLNGQDISLIKPLNLAKKMGVLSQNHHVGYSFSVEEVVKLGRYAYSPKAFSTISDDDEDKIKNALSITGLTNIKHQSVLTLSGGELQRTFLAQLFAQDPDLLVLDEPTNHLDLIYQKQMFGIIKLWMQEKGRSVISVVHDLSLAKLYGNNAILMDKGKAISQGNINHVFTRDNLKKVYGMDVYSWMNNMLSSWHDELS